MIHVALERALRCWPQPQIPIEVSRHGILPGRTGDPLRPDRAVGPNVNLLHRSDHTSLDDLNGAPQPIFGAALVAHLGHDFVIFGQLAQVASFVNRLGQRFLAVNVFPHLDRSRGNDAVQVIRNGNRDRINILLLFLKHLAPVLVGIGRGVLLARVRCLALVRITNRYNVLGTAMLNITAAFASGTDAADPQLFTTARDAWSRFADCGEHRGGGTGQRGVIQEPAASQGAIWEERFVIRHNAFLACRLPLHK